MVLCECCWRYSSWQGVPRPIRAPPLLLAPRIVARPSLLRSSDEPLLCCVEVLTERVCRSLMGRRRRHRATSVDEDAAVDAVAVAVGSRQSCWTRHMLARS